jgi:hypothetical protein
VRRFAVLAALTLGLAGLSCACSNDGGVRGSTFTSPEYGYTLRLPQGWSGLKADRALTPGEPPLTCCGAVDIIGARPSVKVSAMRLPALVIGAQPVPGDMTLTDWTTRATEAIASQKGCPRPSARERITIGDVDGALLLYPDCPKGTGYFHLWAVALSDGRGFHIVWFTDKWNEERDRPQFDRVVESMSFGE